MLLRFWRFLPRHSCRRVCIVGIRVGSGWLEKLRFDFQDAANSTTLLNENNLQPCGHAIPLRASDINFRLLSFTTVVNSPKSFLSHISNAIYQAIKESPQGPFRKGRWRVSRETARLHLALRAISRYAVASSMTVKFSITVAI
jgi:hypothetical protein